MAPVYHGNSFLDVCSREHACQLWYLFDSLVNTVRLGRLESPLVPLTVRRSFPIHDMTPIWIFPAYPLLISAPFASNLIDSLPSTVEATRINSIAIAFGAIALQGAGFLVSLNIYGAFIYRLMTQKIPRDTLKPGMVSLLSAIF